VNAVRTLQLEAKKKAKGLFSERDTPNSTSRQSKCNVMLLIQPFSIKIYSTGCFKKDPLETMCGKYFIVPQLWGGGGI
jgi:hypothetical protein